MLIIHLIYNCRGTAKRLIPEKYRIHGLNSSKPVMVDNLKNLCILNSIYRLALLIMVHKNKLLLIGFHECTARYQTYIIARIAVKHRKVTISELSHNILDISNKISRIKCNKPCCSHKVADRHTLVDKTCRSVCIMRCCYYHAVMFCCKPAYCKRHLCSFTYDYTACIHLYRR